MKQCKKCGVEKALDDFYAYKSGNAWARCKACVSSDSMGWQRANPERTASTQSARKPHKREYNKRWYRSPAGRAWHRANADKIRARSREKNAARNGRKRMKIDVALLQELRVLQGHRCAYCPAELGDRPHLDHVVPLSRGGTHTLDNVVWSCAPCNLSKHAKTPEEWRAA